MVKNFLKRTLCIALSFAMMTGTVMVGAKTKTESIHSKLPAITASQRVRAKQAKASAAAVQLNATNVYTLSDFDTLSNKWQANQEMMLYQGYSDANEYVKVGTIRVGIDGTVVIPYATKVAGVDGGRLKLCYNGNPAMTLSQTNNGKMIWAGAVKAGTYALYLETACENANTPVVAAFGAAVISSQNNRTFGGNNVIASASTGAATYQQFKVSKRGVAAIAVYMVCFALYQKKIFRKKIFTTLICFLFIVETAAMAVMGFQENGTVDTDSYFQDTKAITEVKKEYQKNVETRMELISGRMLDESIWHTLNGMTLFGSTAQGNVVDMMDQLGFYTGVNEYLYEGATPFTNNLMSMKYQIYRPYDTKYTEFSLKESVGNVTVYKNPYRTALAYTMDDLVQTWDYEDYNPFYVQNDLATSAFDVDELFHIVKTAKPQLNDCKITSDNGDGEYVFENTSARPDNMVFTIRSTKTRRLYIHFDGSQVENTVIEKNGEQVLTGRLDSQIIYLGNVQKGDEIRIKMQLKQDNEMSGVVRLTAAELDEEVMEELAQRMQENAWKLTSAKGNHLSGTIHAQEDQMLFFSIPYDKGWTVKIDGKKVKTKALGKAFLTVKVPEGKHKITLIYVSPGFKEGAILSIVGFVIFLLLLYLFRKKKISNIQQNLTENYGTLIKEILPHDMGGNDNKEE